MNTSKPERHPTRMPLIDFGVAPKVKIIRNEEFRARILWLIHLRWVVILGLAVGLPSGQILLHISLLRTPLVILTGVLLLYNALIHIVVKMMGHEISDVRLNIIANAQIAFDLFLLVLFIHFSGGIQNPFVFYFVFHMIIGAIMLTAKAAYLQAAWASFLIGCEISLKYFNVLPYHELDNFLSVSLYHDARYVWTFYLVLVSTLFAAVYMTYSISKELRDREERLLQTNSMLEEKDRLKSQYVLMISHDLKQPLAAIQSNLKVILEGYAGEVSSDIGNLLKRMERRASQLIDLITDLLMISRIRSAKELPKEILSLKPLMIGIMNQLEAAAVQKKLNLRISMPEEEILINGNRDTLRYIFQNLVDNAIKYTPPGGQVTVQFLIRNGKVEGIVEDTGIGIEKEEIEAVFEEFYRAENARKEEKEGTGLGLSVVKIGLTAHGGTIDVTSPAFTTQSGDGVGTRFTFYLPIVQSS
jgi:signal transduction histidine kinase